MTIVTINRSPAWGDMSVGAVLDLPPALADPLIASGEAVPTPAATPTQASPYGEGAGGGVVSSYTEAQLDAMESGGTLVPDTWYAASDSTIFGLATSASTLARVDFDALALAMAQGIVTDDSETINNKAGLPNIAALRALAAANAYPRLFAVSQSSATALRSQQLVAAANTYSGTFTASRPSANTMRIAHATQAHGMGAASDGMYLWVKTSDGVATGIYEITTRGTDPNQIEVDVGAAQDGLITSTTVTEVARLNAYFPAVALALPAGVMGPNGVISFHYAVEAQDNVTNTRYHQVAVGTAADGTGGAQLGVDGGITNTQAYGNNEITGPVLVNMNDVAVQRGFGADRAGSSAPTSHTVNTDAAWYASIGLKIVDIDTWMEVLYFRVDVRPGL